MTISTQGYVAERFFDYFHLVLQKKQLRGSLDIEAHFQIFLNIYE